MEDGNEIVDTHIIHGKELVVYGCYNSDTTETEYDFYDVYFEGHCLNEGEPFYEKPTQSDLICLLKMWEATNCFDICDGLGGQGDQIVI